MGGLALAHHVLFRVPRDLGAVRPDPEGLPDEGLEVRHLVDVRLRHVGGVVALHHVGHLREDPFLDGGVRGQRVQVEEHRRRRGAQPVGEQRQADDRHVLEAESAIWVSWTIRSDHETGST